MTRPREIVRDVLLEAVGSGVTPFVPVPFVDDWIVSRLLRRVARKVLARHGATPAAGEEARVVEGFFSVGRESIGRRVAVGAVRFVVRKVALVLDFKRSHDVFGEVLAFALALDAALARDGLARAGAHELGAILHRAIALAGSAVVESLVSSVRRAFDGLGSSGTGGGRVERVAEALGAEIDDAQARLAEAVARELDLSFSLSPGRSST